MGAAWREVRDNSQFDRVLEMVRAVNDLGVEVCCTLGMLTADQARRLEEAGLYAYNHNLDTSSEFYSTIITTRDYADRLRTIENVRQTERHRLLRRNPWPGRRPLPTASRCCTRWRRLNPHPESVPVNVLCRIDGTPLQGNEAVPIWETVRMIAAARILMPRSVVRLSAGRGEMSLSDQALCFMAGANSIFSSETGRMLTLATTNDYDADREMLTILGLKPREPFADRAAAATVSA